MYGKKRRLLVRVWFSKVQLVQCETALEERKEEKREEGKFLRRNRSGQILDASCGSCAGTSFPLANSRSRGAGSCFALSTVSIHFRRSFF